MTKSFPPTPIHDLSGPGTRPGSHPSLDALPPAGPRRPRVRHCLRGTVGGMEQTYPLRQGDQRVGSLESNDVFLARRGVSRHHAVLRVEGDELWVEDLGSKNGTFVNDKRISTSRVALGSKVRFGPVALYFQEFHQDDAELAISFERPSEELTGTVQVRDFSGGGLDVKLARHWWNLAEIFIQRLYSRPEGDLGAALRLLSEELFLDAACLMEISADGDPVVLAASGQLDQDATSTLRRLYLQALQDQGPKATPPSKSDFLFHATAEGTGPDTTFVALDVSNQDSLILALWGGYPGRRSSRPMLQMLVRAVEPCRPRFTPQSKSRGPTRYPNLVVPPDYVYGQSNQMSKIYRLVESLAPGDLPILIIGETGVGKEYLAQILHLSSPRRSGPFVAINCAAIPAELLESELFGIGEGVATGVAGNRGRIQQAHGGTLVLDEIGDMSPDLQAKLLRALQEKEIHPVGRDPISIDVRVLASTNQDLTQRIESGQFRSDLYYRLAGYVLELPPLRERPKDIPALVEHFLRTCARDLERPIRGVTVRALRLLTKYPWPGNIRELANEVRRAVYLCPPDGTIESSILSEALLSYHETHGESTPPAERPDVSAPNEASSLQTDEDLAPLPGPMGLGLDSLNLASLEKMAVEEALRRCHNNQVQAAKLLGISRQSLRRRIERLEIS